MSVSACSSRVHTRFGKADLYLRTFSITRGNISYITPHLSTMKRDLKNSHANAVELSSDILYMQNVWEGQSNQRARGTHSSPAATNLQGLEIHPSDNHPTVYSAPPCIDVSSADDTNLRFCCLYFLLGLHRSSESRNIYKKERSS
jgi:hypothetical protein